MNSRNRGARNAAASDSLLGVSPEQGPCNQPTPGVVNLADRRDAARERTETEMRSALLGRFARLRAAMKWGPADLEIEHPVMAQARAAINYANHVATGQTVAPKVLADAVKELDLAVERLDRFAAMARHPAGPYRQRPRPASDDDTAF